MSDDGALFDVDEPTTRRCHVCHVERPLSAFYVAREARYTAKRGVRMRYPCRFCKQTENARNQAPMRALIDRIKVESGCVDCGIRDPDHPEIYDFDHLPGVEKTGNVSQLVTRGTVDDVLAEVAKCEVVCANCHRIRTKQREKKTFGMDFKVKGLT